ncbi:MAG: cell division protein FtsQ/DivIB [Cytophagaceae bacterium]|nr:cell division protein FtsQ/DivIB [Cytophagaceae bacterium]
MLKSIFSKLNILVAGSLIFTFGLIGFVEKKTSEKRISKIVVNIKDEYGNYFLDEVDVVNLINLNASDSVNGKDFDEVNLKMLEKRVKVHRFVEDAEVYKDYKGNLIVEVVQCRPVARIIHNDGLQAYITRDGKLLPLTEKFTPRVMIITGDYVNKLLDSAYLKSDAGKSFLKMMSIIEDDAFLKAQIAEVKYKNDGKLDIYTQVGNEVVEFGKPEELEDKFSKFKIYYKKILQLKGFNKYKRVNLEYKDQIICE